MCSYGVAFLYGAKLVREEGYTAGQVMNVIFAAVIGGFSLGQAGPNFGTFATGRTAGYRVFNVIDRKPAIDVADTGVVPKAPMQVRACRVNRPQAAVADVNLLEALSVFPAADGALPLFLESNVINNKQCRVPVFLNVRSRHASCTVSCGMLSPGAPSTSRQRYYGQYCL